MLLRQLAGGRNDAIIADEIQMDYLIATEGFQGQFKKASLRYEQQRDIYLALSKKSPYIDQLTQFNITLGYMVQEGRVENIIASYFEALGKAKNTE
ncbi:transporter substrate-binding domain-containing protein [Motilimonas cestriensis]|uniref:Transporter substrate-binding domain-containing protein n=1 Tax=Motilimonas cestriensis TaxID=2742685 RepID=A0ABS8WC82_9GAMM|nr:transporter substrate-binding domain-containing protein [Motilimonas cestriensis]MCE2595722.1 transporter substrate-binding domain-containing protein [Motilimonas cestriensis]